MSAAPAQGAMPARPVSPDANASERLDWRLVILAFLVLAAILVAKALGSAATVPLLADPDDAMRLVTVRDLLAGQNWFDHLQYRFNTPFGGDLHWSHLLDAAEGGVVLLLRPLAGAAAETVMLYAWPLLLLFIMLALGARVACRLAGTAAVLPAVVLPALAPALMIEFSPGRIDQDSIQILLLLLMVWGCIEAIERPRFAVLAGVAAALTLAIGISGLPGVVAAVLAMALIWVWRPDRAPALRAFGLSFGVAMLLTFAQAGSPSQWFTPACDAISIVYLAFALGIMAAFLLLSVLPLAGRSALTRLLVGGALGAALAIALGLAFPLCLKGPYAALDPWLVHNWLDRIGEAQPLWVSLRGADAFTIGVGLPPLLGLVVIGFRVIGGERRNRGEWLVLGLFLGFAVAVMLAEVRGARFAAPLAIPAAAWLITRARARYLARPRLRAAAALLGSWFGFAGLGIAIATVLVTQNIPGTAAATPTPSTAPCLLPSSFADLAKLPPVRLMTPVDLGSHVLAFTPHAVVAAPYHRNQQAVLDTYHFFNGPIAAARQILAARGVSLVVICAPMPELLGLPDAAPDSFVRLRAHGALPAWLEPVSPPGAVLTIYRVRPD